MAALTIDRAIQTREAESEILDLKRDAYGDKDKDAAEWVKDVTAFANTSGGRILIGVDEDGDGCATEAVGIDADIDKEIMRLGNLLHTLTEPDVSAVTRIRPEIDGGGKKFLVVDIQESPYAPHRLTVQHPKMGGQVYVRRGRSNRPASMEQIRDLVLGTHRTHSLIEEFVADRLNERHTAEAAADIPDVESGPKETYFLFHVCPLRGFGRRTLVDWVLEHSDVRLGSASEGWFQTAPNHLGAFASSAPNAGYLGYHQLFYNGAAELLYPAYAHAEFADGDRFKRCVDQPLTHILDIMYRATGCDQFEIATWIDGVEGTRLAWSAPPHGASAHHVTKDAFELPSVLIRIGPNGKPIEGDLRQLLDLFWRAWGRVKCPI